MHDEFVDLLKTLVLIQIDVTRLSALRRTTTLFSQASHADAIYFIEEGLIKLTRKNSHGGRLILGVYGPNHVVGEESLGGPGSRYHAEAEVLSPATVYRIPCLIVKDTVAHHPELGVALVRFLLDSKLTFAGKVELLCLQDVETRIVHYLEELAKLVQPGEDAGYLCPSPNLN